MTALIDQRITNIVLAKTRGAFFSGPDGSALQDGYLNTNYVDLGLSSGLSVSTGMIKSAAAVSGNLIADMTANSSAGQIASGSSAASTSFGGGYFRAFDRDLSTGWQAVSSPSHLQIDLGSAKSAGKYMLTNKADGAGSPSGWTLSGSPDGTSWTSIDTQSGITWANGETKEFMITPASYRHWKLSFSNTPIIMEFALYPPAASGGVVISAGIVASAIPDTINAAALVKNWNGSQILVSRDNGVTYEPIALTVNYGFDNSGLAVVCGDCDVTGQPGGNTLRYKMALDTNTEVHGVAMWGE